MNKPPSPKAPDTQRSIYWALGSNVAIAAAKLAGALFTGSGALLAEGLHSIADTGNEALLLLGRHQARAPATARHPLGHGRATYFWSFMVTLLLFTVGGVLSIYEGVYKLRNPEPIESPWVAVAIVVFAMIAEGLSLRIAIQQIDTVRGSASLWRWFRETRRSELIVVAGEDLAAVCGLAVALVAILVTIAAGNSAFDAGGSIVIGVLLIVVASGLAMEIKSLLIGESAGPRTRRAIRRFLDHQTPIIDLVELITLQNGESLIVMIQAHVDPALDAAQLMRAIAECKAALKEKFPQTSRIFFEPMAPGPAPARGARARRRRR
jgi:cation diffusion facilitator family transporter